MALADFQDLWTNSIKPSLAQTYATKQETGTDFADVSTCTTAAEEISFSEINNT